MAREGCSAAPRAGRRERKAAETRERIYRSAIQLFGERGMASVTVEQITDRADVGKGTFFNYFLNKEAILVRFSEEQVERALCLLERDDVPLDPAERLRRVLVELADHPAMTQALARDLFASTLASTDQTEVQRPHIARLVEIGAEILRDGQLQGVFRTDLSPEAAALFAVGQYFLAVLAWCSGFSDAPLAVCVETFLDNALRGLQTVPSR